MRVFAISAVPVHMTFFDRNPGSPTQMNPSQDGGTRAFGLDGNRVNEVPEAGWFSRSIAIVAFWQVIICKNPGHNFQEDRNRCASMEIGTIAPARSGTLSS